MNERLTIQDLIDLLAAKHGMTKKDAEAFVKEFFLLIEQALEDEKIVKIKGLGSFKLIDVDSRESVNVNTGERFEIKGHTKVSFVPDTSIKDIINKPFSHFETVVLNEKAVLDNTQDEVPEEDEEESDAIISDEENDAIESAKTNKVEQVVATDYFAETPKKEFETVKSEAIESHDETLKDDTAIDITNEEIISESNNTDDHIESSNIDTPKNESIDKPITPLPQETTESIQAPIDSTHKKKSSTPYLVIAIIIILLLCGGAVLYIYHPEFFSSNTNKEMLDTPQTVQPTDVPTNLPTETDNNKTESEDDLNSKQQPPEKADEKPAAPTVKEEANAVPKQSSNKMIYSDTESYKIVGTKAKYTLKVGESLTRVSQQFYGTKGLWPYIVKHNSSIIKNADNVPSGTTIEIPELAKQ